MGVVRVLVVSARHALSERFFPALPQCEEIRLVGAAATDLQGVDMARLLRPSVVVWEVETAPASAGSRPWLALNGNGAIPEARIILCGDAYDERFIAQAVQLGVWGFVLWQRPVEELVKAIQAVHLGEFWVCRKALSLAFQTMRREAAPAKAHDANSLLSDREQEIVGWLSRGMSNKEIARTLSISDKTVKSHMQHIFRKLKVHRRVQIAVAHEGSKQAA